MGAWTYAVGLSLMAGLATGAGGLLGALVPRVGPRTLGASMGFAAGVMLTVSLADLLPGAALQYMEWMPSWAAAGAAASLCILGTVILLLARKLLPQPQPGTGSILRTAVMVAAALAIHNLPEGMLTLLGGLQSPQRGLRLALAVALHNLPEGLAVSIPVGYALHNRWKGVGWALASGLAEPLGALLALAVLRPILTPGLLTGTTALIAGVMCGACAAELLPGGAAAGGTGHAGAGFAVGVAVMLVGLTVLA